MKGIVPDGIKVRDMSEAAINPYEFLNLKNKEFLLMKTKLCYNFLALLFITFFIGVWVYSSDESFNYPSSNNIDEYCLPCGLEDSQKSGVGGDGKLTAIVGSRTWKDGTNFKWRGVSIAINEDEYLKGKYSFSVYMPHESVIFEFQREELINVNDNDSDLNFKEKS